jgi:pimeloyl-ACP methyl ester carboxylesterase
LGILQRTARLAVAIVAVAALAVATLPQRAAAARVNCDPEVGRLTNDVLGTEVPVVLVHGASFSGDAQQWGGLQDNTRLAGKINNMPNTAVAHIFSYGSTDAGAGAKLAKIVDCASRESLIDGGKGKVVIVGYSQGGMVARYALDHTLADGHKIVGQVGQVVTIGSPNSLLVGVPAFPRETTVYTIASNVTNVYRDWRGNVIERRETNSDGMFTVGQATFGWTADINPTGGGTATVACEKYFVRYVFNIEIESAKATCEHGQMVSNKNSGVHKATTDAIKIFVDWMNRPAAPATIDLTVNGDGTSLTTKYDDRWARVEYGASGPGWDATADDTTNGAACTDCEETPPPVFNPFVYIVNMNWCTRPTMLECAASNITGAAPAVTVGGRTPDSSAKFEEYPGSNIFGYAWCFEAKKICIIYRRGIQPPELQVSQALRDLLSTAIWNDL